MFQMIGHGEQSTRASKTNSDMLVVIERMLQS